MRTIRRLALRFIRDTRGNPTPARDEAHGTGSRDQGDGAFGLILSDVPNQLKKAIKIDEQSCTTTSPKSNITEIICVIVLDGLPTSATLMGQQLRIMIWSKRSCVTAIFALPATVQTQPIKL